MSVLQQRFSGNVRRPLGKVRSQVSLTTESRLDPFKTVLLKTARAMLTVALRATPPGVNPQRRLFLLIEMAGVQKWLKDFDQVRRYLEEAEPLLEAHGSNKIFAMKDWLWVGVYQSEDQVELAEGHLLAALQGFFKLGMEPLQVLKELLRFYMQNHNPSRDQDAGVFIGGLPENALGLIRVVIAVTDDPVCDAIAGVVGRRAGEKETIQ